MSEVRVPFVLVVDDQPLVADTLVLLLKQAHYEAEACYTAAEALIASRKHEPNFLLCDVVLGSVSGLDIALIIQARHPNCKVILMSGNTASAEMLARARRDGIQFPMLAKPIPPGELLALMRTSPATRRTAMEDREDNGQLPPS